MLLEDVRISGRKGWARAKRTDKAQKKKTKERTRKTARLEKTAIPEVDLDDDVVDGGQHKLDLKAGEIERKSAMVSTAAMLESKARNAKTYLVGVNGRSVVTVDTVIASKDRDESDRVVCFSCSRAGQERTTSPATGSATRIGQGCTRTPCRSRFLQCNPVAKR